jgi:uncharacterized protein (TIGR03067 family)
MRIFVSLFAATVLLGAEPAADAVKKEMASLEGEWSMVSGERDGQAIPEELLKNAKRSTKDGETTIAFGDTVYMKAKFTIDPSKKPKEIDYTVTEGDNKDKKQLGIYELDGDTAKFCFSAPDEKRPTDFTAKDGSTRTLSVWKRNKK